jgi:hypothetical protein
MDQLEELEAKLKKAEEEWEASLVEVNSTPHPRGQEIHDITYIILDAFNAIRDVKDEIKRLKTLY